jgi:catalase
MWTVGVWVPEVGSKPLASAHHERYAVARSLGMKQVEAYGQTEGKAKHPQKRASTIESRAEVKARINWLKKQHAAETIRSAQVTREEIIVSLRETRDLAREGTAILAKDGSPTGEKRADLNAKTRADEVLAKMHGFTTGADMAENFDAMLEGMNADEIKAQFISIIEQVDPNFLTRLKNELREELKEEMARSGPSDGEVLQ